MVALTYPVLDFPVYGMEGWNGPRWLHHLEGAGGMPLDGVWLAHGPHAKLFEGPGPWLKVATVPHRRWGTGSAAGHVDPSAEAGFLAWLARGNGTGDELDAARVSAAAHDGWDRVEWHLDGTAVDAWFVPDGTAGSDRWAAFLSYADVFVVLVAEGLDRRGLRLTDIRDGDDYYVDLTRSLEFPDSIEGSRAVALHGLASG